MKNKIIIGTKARILLASLVSVVTLYAMDNGEQESEKETQEQRVIDPVAFEIRAQLTRDEKTELDMQLLYYAREGEVEKVAQLIDQGAYVDVFYDDFISLIYNADKGNEAMVRLLLEKKAQVNRMDSAKRTSLMVAICNSNRVIIDLLLANKADVQMAHEKGDTPLLLAINKKDDRVVNMLLDAHADINALGKHRDTPLIRASRCGLVSQVKILLDRGAHLDLIDCGGRSALLWSNAEIATMLIVAGADTTIKDRGGATLMLLHQDNTSIIEAAIKARADLEWRDWLRAELVEDHMWAQSIFIRNIVELISEYADSYSSLLASMSNGHEMLQRAILQELERRQRAREKKEREL